MWPFRKCNHPLYALWVQKAETKHREAHAYPEDSATVTTYHFVCRLCGEEDLRIKYAEMDRKP